MEKKPKKRSKATSAKGTKSDKKPQNKTATKKPASQKKKVVTKKKTTSKTKRSKKPLRPELPKLPRSITLRNRVGIILLSPYRFPVHMEMAAINTARVAGIAFVVMGAVLAGVNAYSLVNELPVPGSLEVVTRVADMQLAATINATNGDVTNSETSTSTATTTSGNAVGEESVLLAVQDAGPYQINSNINFNIIASEADSIRMFANSAVSNNLYDLGIADQANGAWKYTWDTNGLKAGVYIVYATASINGNTVDSNWERLELVVGEDREMSVTENGDMNATEKQAGYILSKMTLIISSVVVVILGLILILLGMYFHMRDRKSPQLQRPKVSPEPKPAVDGEETPTSN